MNKLKSFSIHGTPKGKKIFEHTPVAQVWAKDEDDAMSQGRNLIKNHPIYNSHFGDDVQARQNGIGGE